MPDLPHGTVTFLFTDIEGSTPLWERDRPGMASAVARHLTLLREIVTMHGGVLYKVVGDAVQAAFPTAAEAVAAALAAQQAFLVEDWGAVGQLRVRMALHAGEATPDATGDYLASPLNRLSRLLTTGHGTQILLSQAAQQLARDQLPPSTALRDLGEHRLRDLREPERVFQLLHPDLPADFPRLRGLDDRLHNLPVQPTAFLGRQRELAAVREQLLHEDVRLVTLSGPGGTGKTRLALQLAADLLEAFPDGAFFVDFAPIADPALVPSAIARVLDVQEAGDQTLPERLIAHLETRRLLLVLDNFERVLAAAPLVAQLLAACPGLTVLATSRIHLRLRGEREIPVPPLGLPAPGQPLTLELVTQYEAVRLFIARAQEVRPDFEVTSDNAPAVAEICTRLDGLPLAIELAAARIKLLPPEALLQRLEHRLPFLTGGARDLPARQQTLRHTIDWSHDLLSEADRKLFRRLAVFAGGFEVEAAEAVGTAVDELDVFEGLTSLADESLLRQHELAGGEPRFWMLETIREYALERLTEAGEDKVVRTAHAAHFLARAEAAAPRLDGADQTQWLNQLESEHPNLRGALSWAFDQGDQETVLRLVAALWPFWERHCHFVEGRKWLEAVLANQSGNTRARLEALSGAGTMAWHQGDHVQATAWHRAALVLARELGDHRAEAFALNNLGVQAHDQGDFAAATGAYEASLVVARAAGERRLEAFTLLNLGEVARLQGEAKAVAPLEEALRLANQVGEAYLVQATLANLALATLDSGDPGRAGSLAREELALARDTGNLWHVAAGLEALACIDLAQAKPTRAARLVGAAEALREAIGRPLPPAERAYLAPILEAARTALGEEMFASLRRAGRALTPEQAIAEALEREPSPGTLLVDAHMSPERPEDL